MPFSHANDFCSGEAGASSLGPLEPTTFRLKCLSSDIIDLLAAPELSLCTVSSSGVRFLEGGVEKRLGSTDDDGSN
jgi:hypothetical protein